MQRVCLIVADASRARIYTFQRNVQPGGPAELLREECDLVDLARRKRASELFSDGSGGNHTGQHGYAFDDHRQAHLDQLDTNFARQIVSEVARVAGDHGYVEFIVVASSRMLGELRAAFAPLAHRGANIVELERDFTKLTTSQLRERLAELELLPPPLPRLTFANR